MKYVSKCYLKSYYSSKHWAAVRTLVSPIKDPAQNKTPALSFRVTYCNNILTIIYYIIK